MAVLITKSQRLLPVFLAPAMVFAVYYVWKQVGKTTRNWSKLLLLLACIPLTWVAFLYAAADTASPQRFVAAIVALNILHSFQYLRLMFFHNKNRYSGSGGVLGAVSRKWVYFFAVALFLALPWRVGANYIETIGPIFVGITFFHFVVDAKIWRIRGDADLARALNL